MPITPQIHEINATLIRRSERAPETKSNRPFLSPLAPSRLLARLTTGMSLSVMCQLHQLAVICLKPPNYHLVPPFNQASAPVLTSFPGLTT